MYAQYSEDDAVLECFKERPHGKLLEIGAWDPITFSNSRALIQKGWDAVLVEPSPGPLKNLAREYAGNDRIQVIGAAVSVGGGLIELAITDDAVTMPTSDVDRHEQWKAEGGFYGKIKVPSLSVAELLNQFGGDFHFISIDTEGTSVPIFLEMLRIGIRPLCVVLEHDDRIVEVNQFAGAANYRQIVLNGTNVVFQYNGAWV